MPHCWKAGVTADFILSCQTKRIQNQCHSSTILEINKIIKMLLFTLPASDNFCHLLISFTNSLDPDQDRQNVGPDLEHNRLKYYYTEIFFEKVIFSLNVNRGQQEHERIPNMERLYYVCVCIREIFYYARDIAHVAQQFVEDQRISLV